MKVAVIGSRGFDDYDLLSKHLDSLREEISIIISGGARGADTLAERWARENDIPTKIYKPDWVKYGRSAGMIRNNDIVTNSDRVIAFWDGVSKGTNHSVNLCKKKNIPVEVIKI